MDQGRGCWGRVHLPPRFLTTNCEAIAVLDRSQADRINLVAQLVFQVNGKLSGGDRAGGSSSQSPRRIRTWRDVRRRPEYRPWRLVDREGDKRVYTGLDGLLHPKPGNDGPSIKRTSDK